MNPTFLPASNATPARSARRGSALILAIGATIPLVIAGGVMLTAITRERSAAEQSVVVSQARDVSASGAHEALARLSKDANYAGSYDVTIGGAQAHVTIAPWKGDGVDNDANGTVDDAGEDDFISITSSGTMNVSFDAKGYEIERQAREGRSATEVIVKKVDLDLAASQAVYIDDALATFKFAGTQFLVNGNDTNIDNSAGPATAIPGIGTPGDPSYIKNQLKANQQPLVIGKGGAPSIMTVADIDLAAQIAALKNLATVTWDDASTSYNGDIGDRPNLNPVIAHAKGSLSLNGSTKGCGILIVDGDLKVNGGFDFVGLIYCSGSVTFNGAGGSKDLHGALYALGAVDGTDITLNGTVQLRYSSEALTIVNTKLSSGVSLVSWTQR